ncbi:MAG: hypothetical protein WBF58_20620 [Xanthobacteraceae bacterium]
MLRQLHQLTIPTAISIAFFDATFLIVAHVFAFNGREVMLGIVAGAVGGTYVLAAVLWQSASKTAGKIAAAMEKVADTPR